MSVTAGGAILLFFSGVVAFVPEKANSNRVDAFLLNVKEHDQVLRVPLDRIEGRRCPVSDDGKYACKEEDGFCSCSLEGGVSISIPGQEPSTRTLPDKPPARLPNDTNAGDIGWLVSMSHVKVRAARIVRPNVVKNVGGQTSFNWTDAGTCQFEEASCKKDGKDWRRIFTANFDVGIFNDPRQAVAELVVFKTDVDVQKVSIHLTKGKAPLVTLRLDCPADDGCPVLITNSMKGGVNDSYKLCDMCRESKAEGEHFREYRRLVRDANGVAPHRLCAEHKDLLPASVPDLCKPGMERLKKWIVAVSNRVICPPVSLLP